MNRTTIFLTDDHELVAQGIASFLIGHDIFLLDESFTSGQELLKCLKQKQPDILLLDYKMPGFNGVQLTKLIKKDYPAIKIVMLSSNADKDSVDEAVKAGCVGYLLKDIGESEFILALNTIMKGENYFSTGVQQLVFNNYVKTSLANQINEDELLSSREVDVIKLFAEGLSYGDIADQLNISKRTVETHKKNILEKLELKSTVDLVKYALLNGLTSI